MIFTSTSDAGHMSHGTQDVKSCGNVGVERQNAFATNQAVSDQAMKMKPPAACGMSMKMKRSKTGGRLIGAHIKVLGSSGGRDSHYHASPNHADLIRVLAHSVQTPCRRKSSRFRGRRESICFAITFHFFF